jgi:hypothetical protein
MTAEKPERWLLNLRPSSIRLLTDLDPAFSMAFGGSKQRREVYDDCSFPARFIPAFLFPVIFAQFYYDNQYQSKNIDHSINSC